MLLNWTFNCSTMTSMKFSPLQDTFPCHRAPSVLIREAFDIMTFFQQFVNCVSKLNIFLGDRVTGRRTVVGSVCVCVRVCV
jgi:hypothetical protein